MIECEICGKKFKNLSGLRGHQRIIHNITHTTESNSTETFNSPITPSTEKEHIPIDEEFQKSENSTASTTPESTTKSIDEAIDLLVDGVVSEHEKSTDYRINQSKKVDSHNVEKTKENNGLPIGWALAIAFVILILIHLINYWKSQEETEKNDRSTIFHRQPVFRRNLGRGILP